MLFDDAKSRSRRLPLAVIALLAIMAVIWCVLFVAFPNSSQKCLFWCNAEANQFCDYFMPRAVSNMPRPYVEDWCSEWLADRTVRRHDQCYPALANYWVGLFTEDIGGATACTFVGVVVFILGMVVFFWRTIPDKVLIATSIVCCSSPFLFAVGVGNLILYTVGFSFVFLAWYDSPSRWRKCVASISLALASVLKISPVLLGLMYFDGRWKENLKCIILAGMSALLLFVAPFFLCGGVDSILAWMANASMNSSEYASLNYIGLFGFVNELFSCLTMRSLPDNVMLGLRVVSSGFGLFVLVIGCRCAVSFWSKGCAVVIGMLFVPPTMMGYTVLYVIPFLIAGMFESDHGIRDASATYCLPLCMLLQFPLLLGPVGSLNVCFSAAASVCFAVVLLLKLIRNGDNLVNKHAGTRHVK